MFLVLEQLREPDDIIARREREYALADLIVSRC